MTLRLAATSTARNVEVDLTVPDGTTLALLGPNGAGKSTALGMLSGLVRPDHGRATLGDDILFDLPVQWSAPHRRGVALLAQDALLFPHLSVRDNVEFGPRAAGATRAEAAARADGWLRRTGTAPFADRHPAELSGGQAQRVAIARALAAEPRMLLLDEPLSALDVSVAAELRAVLGDVLTGRTTVLVTHDALDAYLLADSVAVMHDGRVVEQGPTREVLERPRHPFTAELSGLTLVSGRRTADGMLSDEGMRLSGAVDVTVAEGARVLAAVRPSAVRIVDSGSRARAGSSADPATVTALEPQADLVRVRTDRLSALVAPAIVADCQLTVGAAVWLDVPPDAVSIYPA